MNDIYHLSGELHFLFFGEGSIHRFIGQDEFSKVHIVTIATSTPTTYHIYLGGDGQPSLTAAICCFCTCRRNGRASRWYRCLAGRRRRRWRTGR